MTGPRLRDAGPDDLPAIGEILNREIRETTASWRTVPMGLDALHAWFVTRQSSGLPVVVACDDGVIAGYGSYGTFRAGEGYGPTVEHSVYVRATHRGHGIGGALLAALVARAKAAGLARMVGGISADQPASLALHRRLGFVEAGRLPGVGEKFGHRLDLVLMVCALD